MAKASITRTQITVDGRTYSGLDEMPPAVRLKYEGTLGRLLADRDGNGVPDVFESGTFDGSDVAHVTTTTSEVYEINGRQYESLDDMPPEYRRIVERLYPTAAGSSGLHIRLSWPTAAVLLVVLALVVWAGYVIWRG
jgi:hypothetical protein